MGISCSNPKKIEKEVQQLIFLCQLGPSPTQVEGENTLNFNLQKYQESTFFILTYLKCRRRENLFIQIQCFKNFEIQILLWNKLQHRPKVTEILKYGITIQREGNQRNQEDTHIWKKQGLWSKVKIYEEGGQRCNLRIGFWKYIYKEQRMAVQWILERQITDFRWGIFQWQKGWYLGSFMQNRKSQHFYVNNMIQTYIMNVGSYDQDIKIGIQYELNELFSNYQQVLLLVIIPPMRRKKVHEGITIEKQQRGKFDDEGNCIKIGARIEFSEQFSISSQVIYKGEYNKGKKVCGWSILYRQQDNETFSIMYIDKKQYQNLQVVGEYMTKKFLALIQENGLSYDDEFWVKKQDICNGEYQDYFQIYVNYDRSVRGGSFDDKGLKVGNWIEISEEFCNKTIEGQSSSSESTILIIVIQQDLLNRWFKINSFCQKNFNQ
ncbi:unnamed protein product [Paramecium octaurelia]|uniref:Uncharacterized protein n=1 Tax=Paramecium octaurelia TaxID=43137 RepID=A0A8S1RZE3_PAROT|nr:unnamed protein product [Paramecium octaurelia]